MVVCTATFGEYVRKEGEAVLFLTRLACQISHISKCKNRRTKPSQPGCWPQLEGESGTFSPFFSFFLHDLTLGLEKVFSSLKYHC